jgi:large subunit ribosomal protein L17
MHRHGYKGRKFNRERDQREALIKSLAESLIIHESIETTLPKAKEVVPYVEKLITKAKKGDLHSRRLIISDLQTISTAHKLVDEIAPKLKGRDSGHLRVKRTILRRGDNAQLARVSFVDDLKEAPVAKATPKSAQVKSTESRVVSKKPIAAKAQNSKLKTGNSKKEAK